MSQSATISDAAVPEAPAVSAHTSRWHWAALYLAGIELLVLYAPTMRWLWERWTLSVWHNAHGMFIPPLVGYLAYQELRPLASRPASSSSWGWWIVAVALGLQALDAGMHTELLSAFSLLLILPGLALLLLGAERTKAIAFPLAFMAFALPIPLGITETLHLQLRVVVVKALNVIVPMLGVPVFTEGTEIHLANGVLQVADACSGFSTLYAAAAVACLVAYTTPSLKRRLLVLAAAAPIAIASNIARVAILVLLTAWKGQGILETWVHPASGMLTFVLSLPLIFWLGGDSRQQSRVG